MTLSPLIKFIVFHVLTGQIEIAPEQPAADARRGTAVVIAIPDTDFKNFVDNGWIIIDQSETPDGTIFYCVQHPRAKL